MVDHVAHRQESESVKELVDRVARLVDGHDDDTAVPSAQAGEKDKRKENKNDKHKHYPFLSVRI